MVPSSSIQLPPPLADTPPPSMLKLRMCKKRPRRHVGFADERTYCVTVLDQLTEQERANTWYTSEDYAVFGKEVKAAVKRMRRGHAGDCDRGLEKYQSSTIHHEKKQRELSHYRSILSEQQRQRDTGAPNPKVLRMLSTINSKRAMQNAIDLAQNDAQEARKLDFDADYFSDLFECPHFFELLSDSESETSESEPLTSLDSFDDGFGKFHPV
uniref:Uncharacterized protein n=1 Tax=Cyclophora tenuis TaxID=216820 RepID=A0A7S1D7G8_CYCTE|mmetsp:Transcript_2902/g.4988  ORF Transcript_2902/g.4988 Transcript_2902/m.4988 type:complete len:212 (+) Transcript_2902:64-699(+)|eukprot:CAMPEP_0116553730 /NCGR_PEP_ID=MMETSP0397-20121206/7205_1 /TAXON_ID=216820 /ORGANISM="Cyclophora tenuis, Strain ECT3854" /LENGTH=211 /DNA_ID=CAMNT_0004078825 /DNA_START=46 /DNA_END=681 /DNA_ORIENTATION=-